MKLTTEDCQLVNVVDFRARAGAAPLKLRALEPALSDQHNFRARAGAAPLKLDRGMSAQQRTFISAPARARPR